MFILAFDQGTTSSRAILFDAAGSVVGSAQQEFRQIFPRAGWVEHDAEEIWTSQLDVARTVLTQTGVAACDVAAIGIANQRETTVVWDRRSGRPIYHAIVWQDRRTSEYCDRLKREMRGQIIQQKTGLVIDAYFSGSKIRWILDNVEGARQLADDGHLAFGTVDSWLIWNLTGGRVHVTDTTNACRTMLFNLHTLAWDDELLAIFNIPRSLLPTVCASSEIVAETNAGVLGMAIPIAGIAGDQQAALFGQNCVSRGLAKNTYGTGCFMLMNVGSQPAVSQHRLLSTVAWTLPTKSEYALEGSVFIGGAVVQWLRDGLGIVKSAAEIEEMAGSVADTGGVYLVPAFAGLGAPHWDQYARGSIAGITRSTTAAHLARAALESIAFQVADVADIMQRDSGISLTELRVDGGAAANNLLLQFQADLLQVPVVRPMVTESTAMGAASLAGLAVGMWKNTDELQARCEIDRVFEPIMNRGEAEHRRARWNEALRRSLDWEERKEGRPRESSEIW